MKGCDWIKRSLFLLMLVVFLGSCDKKNEKAVVSLKGDLHYPWIKFGNFYDQPDSLFQRFEAMKDTIGYELIYKEDSIFARSLQVLEENELLKSPFIYMITETDSIVIVYMNPQQYEPFTKFTYANLVENQQKISVALSASQLYSNLYRCEEVKTVAVVASDQPIGKDKLARDDYR